MNIARRDAQINGSRRVDAHFVTPFIYILHLRHNRVMASLLLSLPLCVLSVLKFDVGEIKAKPQAGKSPALSDEI